MVPIQAVSRETLVVLLCPVVLVGLAAHRHLSVLVDRQVPCRLYRLSRPVYPVYLDCLADQWVLVVRPILRVPLVLRVPVHLRVLVCLAGLLHQ